MADEKKARERKTAKKAGKKNGQEDPAKKPRCEKRGRAEKTGCEKSRDQKIERKKRLRKKPRKAKEEPAKKAAPKAPVAPPVVRASARYVRIAPRKARLIADQVRGLHIEKARALLQFSPRGAAEDIHKLIDSAAANAENNHDLIGDEMKVSSITVDEGPTLKRFRPRAMGRATPIHKRTSHIAVALTPVED